MCTPGDGGVREGSGADGLSHLLIQEGRLISLPLHRHTTLPSSRPSVSSCQAAESCQLSTQEPSGLARPPPMGDTHPHWSYSTVGSADSAGLGGVGLCCFWALPAACCLCLPLVLHPCPVSQLGKCAPSSMHFGGALGTMAESSILISKHSGQRRI